MTQQGGTVVTLSKCRKGQRMIKEIHRLHEKGIGKKKIARAMKISVNTVRKYLELSEAVSSDDIQIPYSAPWAEFVEWELVKAKTQYGTPLSQCWEDLSISIEELKEVGYTSFWREYKRRYPDVPLELHKVYQPGLRCEVDYKGKDSWFGYYDLATDKFVVCRLFGSVLCFSQMLYACATLTEKRAEFISSIAHAFEYFGGTTETLAFDNTKAAVDRADRYDPDINPEFDFFCEHFDVAPLAMRPGEPKDKAVIENSLGVFTRWIRPKFKAQKFYSLEEINRWLDQRLEEFNKRVQRKYQTSRLQKYQEAEKKKLQPLPNHNYSWGEWKKSKVHPDCHIQIDKNFYSVPYQHRGQEVDVRRSHHFIEVFVGLERVAVHNKLSEYCRGRYNTSISHLPEKHLAVLEVTPQFILEQASKIGEYTHQIVSNLIEKSRHPLMFLRRTQGIIRLEKKYSREQLEAASKALCELGAIEPKLHDFEKVMLANRSKSSTPKREIKRNPNPHLRGQSSWNIH